MEHYDLKQLAISGVVWTAIQRFGMSIIQFLSNMVLARLLTPDDYGCIGMLGIFLAISTAFISGGFVSALIQKINVTEEDFSTVFYWNITVSILCYILLFWVAPLIAEFYHIAELSSILRVLGIILIINGISIVHETALRKNLQFNKLAKINIISSFIATVVAILLAFIGGGVWTLVVQQLILRIGIAIMLWNASSWYPKLIFSQESFKTMFSYGSFLLLSDLINNIVDNIQGLIIGRKYSSGDMGYYTQAKKLEEIPTYSITQLVGQVTFPIYAKLQKEQSRLKQAVRKSLLQMNFINFPLMLLLIVIANPLIKLLYSERWLNAVEYFQILCIAGLVNCMQSVNYQVVGATGHSKTLFKWNLVKRSIGILFMFWGMYYGVKGILWGMVFGTYFTYIINAFIATKLTGYGIIEQLKDFFPQFSIAVVCGFIVHIVGLLNIHYIVLLIIQIVVYSICYVKLSSMMKREEYFETKDIVISYIEKMKHGGYFVK